MYTPQVIVVEPDGWIARHLSDIAAEGGWLVRGVRSSDSVLSLTRERGPCVLIVQVELAEDKPASLRLIADLRRTQPDVSVVAVSESKMSDVDRVAWTAALFDLGARYVLFPPLTQPILEDVVAGLMAATIPRIIGAGVSTASKAVKPKPRRAKEEEVIDLADEDVHE